MSVIAVLFFIAAVSNDVSVADGNYTAKTNIDTGLIQPADDVDVLWLKIRSDRRQWEATTRTCSDSLQTGQFVMQLDTVFPPFKVVCFHAMQSARDKWLVIQQRVDGSVNFFRNWAAYRDGFGNLDTEFWLGLEKIHQITWLARYELLVELVDFEAEYKYARYASFAIDSEEQRYALKDLGSYTGTAGDAMRVHVGERFSTFDNDNDKWASQNCPIYYHGAWWYDKCTTANGSSLNGKYENSLAGNRIRWRTWDDSKISYTRMMLRLID